MATTVDYLKSWKPDRTALEALFTPEELARIDEARRAVVLEQATVAYCVYENPFARAGGIFAVATQLPPALREAGLETVLISPLHRGLASAPSYDEIMHRGGVELPFSGGMARIELFEYFDGAGNRWILIQADGVFDAPGGPARKDPYAHRSSDLLLRDALFASAAVPYVLEFLGLGSHLIVHAQDWQFAPTALTVKEAVLGGRLGSAAVVLTSHNPYDHALSDLSLGLITGRVRPGLWPLGRGTVYQRMIPLTDAPLSTVSRGFARELSEDPLQTGHFARHLQPVYRAQGIVGIDNPLFGAPRSAFSATAARSHDAILKEKIAARAKMLQTLEAYRDERILGGLDGGDAQPLTQLPNEVPVFMMFGRMDPGQKGFDLLARAIEGFPRGAARFILTPIVGDGTAMFADDLRRLAEQRRGDVAVYPFRMEAGYMEAMAGASFAVMPSFYEPFGAASEAYLAGTPVVARATGGLTDQVADYRVDALKATGFLFREKLPLGSSWPSIMNAATPEQRVEIPLYAMIAEALFDALNQAADLWRHDAPAYARMLQNLYPKAMEFSSERAAGEYAEWYRTATG